MQYFVPDSVWSAQELSIMHPPSKPAGEKFQDVKRKFDESEETKIEKDENKRVKREARKYLKDIADKETSKKRKQRNLDKRSDNSNLAKKFKNNVDEAAFDAKEKCAENTKAFEKLTETSLEETLKCLEDLLEDENFAELSKTNVTEDKSPVNAEESYESKLEKHLETLREPLVENFEKTNSSSIVDASNVNLQIKENDKMPGLESMMCGRINEYNIKQEPTEDLMVKTNADLVDPVVFDGQSKNNDYNIKQEVIDESYLGIKEEPQIKQEFGEIEEGSKKSSSNIFKPEEDEDDDDEVMIIESPADVSDICDVLVNIFRCEECFQSFQSAEQFNDHTKTHKNELLQKFASRPITEEKYLEISSSRYPKIGLCPVSMKNHPYIQLLTQPIMKTDVTFVKKPEPLAKMTTLQALDDLFAPIKSTKKTLKPIIPSENKSSDSSKKKFLKELDKVFEKSSKTKKVFAAQARAKAEKTKIKIHSINLEVVLMPSWLR